MDLKYVALQSVPRRRYPVLTALCASVDVVALIEIDPSPVIPGFDVIGVVVHRARPVGNLSVFDSGTVNSKAAID